MIGVFTLSPFRLKHSLLLLVLLSALLLVTAVSAQDYEPPAPPDDVDLSQVIARVGDDEITLEDFVQRVRFERVRYYLAFERLIRENGVEALDIENPDNQFAPAVQQVAAILVSERDFAAPIYDTMLLERLYHQEALERGIEVDECEMLRLWSQIVNVPPLDDCEPTEEYTEARAQFLDLAQEYAGLSEDDVEAVVRSRAEYDAVYAALGDDLEIEDVQAVRTRHIRVDSAELADEVRQRLLDGEDFETLLAEFSLDEGVGGNGGELGVIGPGQTTPAFEEAAFSAEVGEIVGPIDDVLGYHILQVNEVFSAIQARHILLETEEEANTALRLLEDGADFGELAQRYSIDTGSGMRGGDLGEFGPGQMVPEFEEAAFGAEIGEIVGPVETQFGFHIIEVTGRSETPMAVDVRHILLETEEDAQAALERLNDGADFNELAREVSVDWSAAGHRGDTLTIFSQGTQTGYYTPEDEVPLAFDEAVFAAEAGDILEPIETRDSYFVVEVQDFTMRPPRETVVQRLRDEYAQNWQQEQLASDHVETTDLWREYIPADPRPSDVFPDLLQPLDTLLEQSQAEYEQFLEQTRILNVLRELELPPDPEAPESEAPESETPESEAPAPETPAGDN